MKTNETKNHTGENTRAKEKAELYRRVENVVKNAPVIDIRTHLYPSEFGALNSDGIDELMTCQYLIAETFRSIVAEITPARLELLGTSFIPQHSDARVLERLIYKWKHSRRVIAECLCETYERLSDAGRSATREEIERDVTRLFSGNFRDWINLPVSEKPECEKKSAVN